MASYQITCPIIKSSNDSGYSVVVDHYFGGTVRLSPSATSNYLAVAYRGEGSPKTRIGIAWDDSAIPENKRIVSVELHYYGTRGHGNTVFYKYGDFAEGSTIPSHEPADGSVTNATGTGWRSIDLGEPKGNSVILYAELETYNVSVYTPDGQYAGTYPAAESWEFYSQRNSTNQPYVIITYEDVPPDPPTGLYPSGGTISTRDGIRFAWSHNSAEGLAQKGFVLQYSLDRGNTWTTVEQTTSDQFYELEANVLPLTGTVTWRVKTIDENDVESEFVEATFTLGVLPQKPPVPVSPISQYVMEGNPVRFEWVFVGGSEREYQAKYDLQYSIDGGVNWTTISGIGGNSYHTVPAGTFAKGNVSWRIRTYNQWDDVSPYSDIKTFTIIGVPAVPLITGVSNKARPVIKWQTQEQQIYEIEILKGDTVVYHSGSRPDGAAREYNIPIYLDNGEYIARVRVVNEYSLYSAWAEKRFTISVEKPTKPSISVYNGGYKVTIKTDSDLKALAYRDGELIGEMIDGVFEDYTGANNTEYQYFIRAIDINDNFADSEIKLGKCRLMSNTIATTDNPADFIKLEYGLDGIPEKSDSISVDATTRHYDGRRYPVTEYAEFTTEAKSMAFYFETKTERDRLKSLISQRKYIIYRDVDGDVIIGSVLSADFHKTILGYSVDFTITRTV